MLPSLTKAKRKLLRQNKPSLTSVSIYLVSAAASAVAMENSCNPYLQKMYLLYFISSDKEVVMAKVELRSIFAFTLGDYAFIEITS